MKASIRILAGLWISISILSGCSMNRADSLRMLDRRAEYEDATAQGTLPPPGLKQAGMEGFGSAPIPVRTRPKVASI